MDHEPEAVNLPKNISGTVVPSKQELAEAHRSRFNPCVHTQGMGNMTSLTYIFCFHSQLSIFTVVPFSEKTFQCKSKYANCPWLQVSIQPLHWSHRSARPKGLYEQQYQVLTQAFRVSRVEPGHGMSLRRFPLNVRAVSAKIKLPKKYLQHCHILRTDKKNLSLLLLPS